MSISMRSRVAAVLALLCGVALAGCGGGGGGSASGVIRPRPGAYAITSVAPSAAVVGQPYGYTVTTSDGRPFSLTASGLPAWLAISGATIAGTPGPADAGTNPSISITASNGTAQATQAFRIAVAATGPNPNQTPPQFTNAPPGTAQVGVPYAFVPQASGNPQPTITATGLPGWLQLKAGGLSGTPGPGDVGTTAALLLATNGVPPAASLPFTITVTAAPAPTTAPQITSTPPAGTAEVYVPYSYAITTTGSAPIALTATGLPSWLALNGNVLEGTPNANQIGTYGPIVIRASNGLPPDATQSLTITVAAATSSFRGGAVEFDFMLAQGNETTFNATVVAPGFASPATMRRGPGIAPPSSAVSAFGGQGWTLGATIDPDDHYAFAVSPTAASMMTLGSLTLTQEASSSGPKSWALRSSLDGFSTDLGTFTTGTSSTPRTDTVTFTAVAFSNLTVPVEFRIYGYGATGALGTWRIDDVIVAATATARASAAGAPAIVSTPPTAATVGTPYGHTLVVSGSPVPTIGALGLPRWLAISGGTLSGTPTQADVGTSTAITLIAANGNAPTATRTFTIQVAPSSTPVFAPRPATATSATEGQAYAYAPQVTGAAPIALAATISPLGWLSFNGTALTGTPGALDVGVAVNVTLTATNSFGSATQSFAVAVSPGALPGASGIVVFDFTGNAGDEVSVDATTVHPDLAAPVTIVRGSGLGRNAGGDSFNSNGWTSATSPDPGDYVGFTVGPRSGFEMSLSSLDFDERRSSSGPLQIAIRSSLDGFAGNVATLALPNGTSTVRLGAPLGAGFRGLVAPVELRIYGYQSGGGTLRFEDIVLTGAVTATAAPVAGAPTFTAVPLTSGTALAPYSSGYAVSGNATITVQAANLPGWLAHDPVARTLTGTPPAAGTYGPITLVASNGIQPDATHTFSIVVAPAPVPPAFTTQAPATATEGRLYSYAPVIAGSPTSVTATALPAWLTFVNGVLSGTPRAQDVGIPVSLTLTATNAAGSATQPISIAVSPSAELVRFGFGTGGALAKPVSFTADPPVAPGIVTPVAFVRGPGILAADVTDAINASDWPSTTSPTADDHYSFTVAPVPGFEMSLVRLDFKDRRNNTGGPAEGAVYSSLDGFSAPLAVYFPLTTTALSARSVPLGASFTALTGPVEFRFFGYDATASTSTYRLDDVVLAGTVTFSASATAPTIQPGAPTAALVGAQYTYPVSVSGTPTPTLSLSGNPGWLSVIGGTVSGTPPAGSGGTTGPITLTASNGLAPDATETWQIAVDEAPAITSVAPAQTVLELNSFFSYAVSVTGTPAPALGFTGPAWLAFSGSSLQGFTADPGEIGPHAVTITATNRAGAAAPQTFTIHVVQQAVPPSISTFPSPNATVGALYSQPLAASGSPAPTVTLDPGAPAWLQVVNNSELRGTPGPGDVGNTGILTLRASNGVQPDFTRDFSINVDPAPSPADITSPAPTSATAGALYEYAIVVTGAPTPVVQISGLPFWLVRNGLTLRGTPPAGDAGKQYTITIDAVNASGADQQVYTLSVSAPPPPTPATSELVKFTFTGAAGNQASSNADAGTDPGLQTPVVLTRGPGLVANAASNVINSNSWTTAASPDYANDYYTFSVTPVAGSKMTLKGLSFRTERNSNGPQQGGVRSSLDLSAQGDLIAPFTPASSIGSAAALKTIGLGAAYENLTGTVEFRIAGWQAVQASGTMRLDDVILTGYTQPVSVSPTPAPILVLGESFENSGLPSGWTTGVIAATTTAVNDWQFGAPASGPRQARVGSGVAATVLNGLYTSGDSNGKTSYLQTPALDLTGIPEPVLRFHHWYETETDIPPTTPTGYDGARVTISVNGAAGPFEALTIGSVTPPYDGTIAAMTPMDGELAWFGLYGGAAGGRLYEPVTVSLSANLPAVGPRDRVVLRFEFGADISGRYDGWYIDEVYVGDAPAIPQPAAPEIRSIPVIEAEVGVPYSYTVQGTGAPLPTVDFANLPPWLPRVAGTVTITGTPQPGDEGFWGPITIAATNGVLPDAVQRFTILVRAAGSAPTNTPVVEDFTGVVQGGVPRGWTKGGDFEAGFPDPSQGAAYDPGGKCAKTNLSGNYRVGTPGRLSFLQTPSFDLTGMTAPRLVFAHLYDTEANIDPNTGNVFGFDGANVKISTDGGVRFFPLDRHPFATSFVAGDPFNAFFLTSYTLTQGGPSFPSPNPLAGQTGWALTNGAYELVEIDLGLDLLGHRLDNVVVRFEFGADDTVSYTGWFVDQVRIGELGSLPPP